MRIIRVFPRKTKATPDDDLVVIGKGPGFWDEADEVHISVTFSWDVPLAESLAEEWKKIAPVLIGGPATGMRSEQFVSGKYIKPGYVITSRGCPNKCWFCDVWRREGTIRELKITEGWNVLDDNLLACSDAHIMSVFDMLSKQKQAVEFTGGLEAARLKPWHARELRKLKPKQMFFAYDTPDDYEPLVEAGQLLLSSGFTRTSHTLRAYVLCGYPRDSYDAAEKRMKRTIEAGFMPMGMLYRDSQGHCDTSWRQWQRLWCRPRIVAEKMKWYAAGGERPHCRVMVGPARTKRTPRI